MVDGNEYRKHPPGPLLGLWSWRYLAKWKTLRMVTSKEVRERYARFGDIYPPGTEFPEVELETTEGSVVNTRDFLGKKHLVFFTGAIT